jgi:hypothetical protein
LIIFDKVRRLLVAGEEKLPEESPLRYKKYKQLDISNIREIKVND